MIVQLPIPPEEDYNKPKYVNIYFFILKENQEKYDLFKKQINLNDFVVSFTWNMAIAIKESYLDVRIWNKIQYKSDNNLFKVIKCGFGFNDYKGQKRLYECGFREDAIILIEITNGGFLLNEMDKMGFVFNI